MKTKKSCERYGNWFKKQIQKLQKINPEAQFIIIGPGDMSTKDKTELITYPLLINVRDELRDAALETNSCFWDMYLNMGGENSIQEWASEDPALAAKDYIHFTNLGARKIADMFISDLMEDYKSFKMNNINE
jgi:lysophospholipase L1-like esterase